MSWFGKDKETAENSARRGGGPAFPQSVSVRRGPVIRITDLSGVQPDETAQDAGSVAGPAQSAESAHRTVAQEPLVERPGAERAAEPGLSAPPPLIDTRSVMQAIWTYRRTVLMLAFAGAVAAALVAPLTPRKFTAATSLYFDPRQADFSDAPQAQAAFNKDAFVTVIDSRAKILASGRVLSQTAMALGLDKDPFFVNGAEGASMMPFVIANLERALKIAREDNTFVVNLSVTTNDPSKSAKIANQVVATFLMEENSVSSSLLKDANSVLDGRLGELGLKLEEAEKAVETYKADNDMVTADGVLIADKRLVALNELLVAAQNRTIEAKAKADAAAKLTLEDMVAASSADDASSQALVQLRRQYGALAADIGSLESHLGSRHPKLLAARASLNGLSVEIRKELARYASSAQSALQQARKAEEDVAKELTVQKALQTNASVRLIALHELERKAAAAREIYEATLKRTRRTNEEQNLARNNVRVISPAEPPLKADGPGFTTLVIAAVFGGTLLGLTLGIVYAIVRMLAAHRTVRSYFSNTGNTTGR